MSFRLQSVLQDFKEQNITAADMTADELEALVHAVERVNNPYSDINADLCETPVEVCRGLYLWPLTAGAYMWLEEYAGRWWSKSTAMYRWAQTYALYYARDPDAFAKLTDKWTARKAIVKTALRFTCHRAELTVAKNRCYGIGQYDVPEKQTVAAPDEQAVDFAHFAAMLEVESGTSAKSWLFGKSLVALVKTYRRMKLLKNALGGADAAEKLTFELNDALSNLARVKSMISERITAEKAAKESTRRDDERNDGTDGSNGIGDHIPSVPQTNPVSPVRSHVADEKPENVVAVVHDNVNDTTSNAGGQP